MTALEIEADLARRARENLADRGNVAVAERSGTAGALPESDVIYVNAGATHPPAPWLDALADGGRLLFPLTGSRNLGMALLVTRRGDRYEARAPWPVGFVPCAGAREAAEDLDKAFQSANFLSARSLRAQFVTRRDRAVRMGRRLAVVGRAMKTFYSPAHLDHAPPQEFESGKMNPAVEVPARRRAREGGDRTAQAGGRC